MFKLFEKESIIAYLIYSILILLLGIKVFSIGVLDMNSKGSYFFDFDIKCK
jgi:fumarate reductase subunit D